MQDILSMLSTARRPRLLIRAARHGAAEYRRDRHLQRLLGYGRVPRSAAAVVQLMEIERAHEDRRVTGDTGYSLVRHLDVMIALMGEARLLRESQRTAGRAG